MSQIGRNDPCPCGSGRKYKKCCLTQQEAVSSRSRIEQSAVQTALSWLHSKYPDEVSAAVYIDFMGERTEEEMDELEHLSPHLNQAVSINIGEWLLTDAELEIKGKKIPTIELILGTKGPGLNLAGRAWLTEIARRSMSLYEVCDVNKGEGMLLRDLVHPDDEPIWIHEKSASEEVVVWDIFGARLARNNENTVLTGAVYPMERQVALDCLDEIFHEMMDTDDEPALVRKLTAWTIIDFWLDTLVEERTLPQVVDMGSGEKIDLTTDYYRVSSWDNLEQALAQQDDVEGDKTQGWTRFVELEDGRLRSLAVLSAKGERLEVFCRTLKMADEARCWLEDIAGTAVAYKIRDIVDPRSSKAYETLSPESSSSEIPQEMQRQVVHDYLQKHYDTWTTTPLPVLEGKSPKQAVRSKKGRAQVVELLKSMEQLEQKRIAQTGGDPFDVTFLWDRLGLSRG